MKWLAIGQSLGSVQINEKITKVDSTHGFANWWHQDVLHHGRDNFPERRADNNADCQIDDIAFHGELFEFFDHAHNGSPIGGWLIVKTRLSQRTSPRQPSKTSPFLFFFPNSPTSG